MQDGKNRMMEQHSESGIFHHFFITSFHFFGIAVDFIGTAECLWLYEGAFICLFPGVFLNSAYIINIKDHQTLNFE